MTPRELEEYSALRATIARRGTARVWIVVAGLAIWSAEAIATVVLATPPAMALIPLLFLAAVFEAVFALHTGVERIGRYIQVFHETPADQAAWEATAMAFARPRGTAADPLFIVCFVLATILNFAPVMLAAPLPVEVGVISAAHLVFLGRMFVARGSARTQRAAELERFREMKNEAASGQ
jgi:hypothetical protein